MKLTRLLAPGRAALIVLAGGVMAAAGATHAQNVDLVITMVADQPAYMVQETEHYTVTVSNNGPATATNVSLVVTHPLADQPFEASATCQPVPGPNPNGPAVCPAGSATAPSVAFVRSGDSFSVTIPSIPSQSMVRIAFENASRCARSAEQAGGEARCIMPGGNYTLSGEVSSPQNEVDPGTNRTTTNIFLYPPDSQYRIEITQAPANAVPGQVVEYEFEVTSMGLNLSHMLTLGAQLRGLAGDMTPMSAANAPFGPSSSTLPGTRLLSIDCLGMSLGTYPASQVFPASPAIWQACPSNGLIPIPQPVSGNNAMPVRGFDFGTFLENLPGTQLGPVGGGVMRFRARVEVGEPVCVAVPENGHRELEFRVDVTGMPGTDLVAPGAADNSDTAITQVPATCEEADIQFITSAAPVNMNLDGNGQANWTQTTTISNLSAGATAGTATQVPVEFGHRSLAFSQTRTALTCNSVPAGLCPDAVALVTGVNVDTATAFRFAGTLAALPPGATVTFSQDIVLERTACWSGMQALVNLSGQALPSPALFDPDYNPLVPMPPDFTPGINVFYGNNGMQTVATVDGLTPCPGGGVVPTGGLELVKTGPYASAADAANAGALIGQTPATAIADGTEIFFNITVRNPDAVATTMLRQISDWSTGAMGLQSGDAGFVHTGPLLADWGITCTGSSPLAPCHDWASSFQSGGYISSFQLEYDPALHGGNAEAALAPLDSLTYIVPFTTPSHLNRCHGPTQFQNRAEAHYQLASGALGFTPQSLASYYVGGPDCDPGVLQIEKEILAPADAGHIPTSGLLGFRLTLTNLSANETLDIARVVDQPIVNGVQVSVVSITCNSLGGGAQCPATAIVPGMRTQAGGASTPLPDPLQIDHEWGSMGNATFPPGSSLELIVTYQLSEPTRDFSCFGNRAEFSGENDPNGWVPDDDQVWVCPPPTPELSLQKQVDLQIVGPDAWVTYTLIVTNIGAASADGAFLEDLMPANLQAANPVGFSNVTCTNITASSSLPNPHGVAVCPAINNGPGGLSATIATLGPNTALRFTYQAQMPDAALAPVSVANVALLVSPSAPGGLSFGAGAVQSHQNVQVIAAGAPPPVGVTSVPALSSRWLVLMVLGVFAVGLWRMQMRPS